MTPDSQVPSGRWLCFCQFLLKVQSAPSLVLRIAALGDTVSCGAGMVPRGGGSFGACLLREVSRRPFVYLVLWILVASACFGWRCSDNLTWDGNSCSDGDTSADGPRGHHHLDSCHGESCLSGATGPCVGVMLPQHARGEPSGLHGPVRGGV